MPDAVLRPFPLYVLVSSGCSLAEEGRVQNCRRRLVPTQCCVPFPFGSVGLHSCQRALPPLPPFSWTCCTSSSGSSLRSSRRTRPSPAGSGSSRPRRSSSSPDPLGTTATTPTCLAASSRCPGSGPRQVLATRLSMQRTCLGSGLAWEVPVLAAERPLAPGGFLSRLVKKPCTNRS